MTNYLIKKFIPNYRDSNNPQVREKFGMLSGIIGIICNIILFAGKFFAGLMTSSIAVSQLWQMQLITYQMQVHQ